MFAEQHGPLLPTLTHSAPPVQPRSEQVVAITRSVRPGVVAFLAAAALPLAACGGGRQRADEWAGPPRPDDRAASTSAASTPTSTHPARRAAPVVAATRFLRLDRARGRHDVDRRARVRGGLGPDDGHGHARRPPRRLGAGAAVRARVEQDDDGDWRLTSAETAQRCRPGRGHQAFSPAPCSRRAQRTSIRRAPPARVGQPPAAHGYRPTGQSRALHDCAATSATTSGRHARGLSAELAVRAAEREHRGRLARGERERVVEVVAAAEREAERAAERVARAVGVRDRPGERRGVEVAAVRGAAARAVGLDDDADVEPAVVAPRRGRCRCRRAGRDGRRPRAASAARASSRRGSARRAPSAARRRRPRRRRPCRALERERPVRAAASARSS